MFSSDAQNEHKAPGDVSLLVRKMWYYRVVVSVFVVVRMRRWLRWYRAGDADGAEEKGYGGEDDAMRRQCRITSLLCAE